MIDTEGEELPFGPFDGGQSRAPAQFKTDMSMRLWSRDKARLIAEYLKLFVTVAKHGTYIDGFAGPQGHDDAWSARLVIEAQPSEEDKPRLRHFYLFDQSTKAVQRLNELKNAHPGVDIHVRRGDFNESVKEILDPQVIGPREATFCLLDQRTFECEWQTVRALAAFKTGQYKVELFYFLANAWWDRAVVGSTTEEGRNRITRWWGSDDWSSLRGSGVRGIDRAKVLTARFEQELGYRYAIPWQVYERKDNKVVMYFMIHATDHDAAPSLMARAYAFAVRPLPPPQTELPF